MITDTIINAEYVLVPIHDGTLGIMRLSQSLTSPNQKKDSDGQKIHKDLNRSNLAQNSLLEINGSIKIDNLDTVVNKQYMIVINSDGLLFLQLINL